MLLLPQSVSFVLIPANPFDTTPPSHHSADPRWQDLIHWDLAGRQIIIEKPGELEIVVLPEVYKQSRFASFSRQLNVSG